MALQLRLAGQDGEVPLALSQPAHDLVLFEGGHQGQLLQGARLGHPEAGHGARHAGDEDQAEEDGQKGQEQAPGKPRFSTMGFRA